MVKETKKRILIALIMGLLLVIMTGCGFSIGSPTKSEHQADLFPDKYEGQKGTKSTYMAYTFTLDGLGEMQVYVDTTEGHKFELEEENSGFNILDKDGNTVLYAACMNNDAYRTLTAQIDDVETINGRDFLYIENNGSIDAFSYMADCGLDCGLVLESHTDADVFRLVAFRGTALEGASSDPYAYKGTASDTELNDEDDQKDGAELKDNATDEDSTQSSQKSGKMSTLDADVENALATLDTDYNKINWGITYAPYEDYPGFVISIAPFVEYGENCLLVAFTNLYEDQVSFSADAVAYGTDGSEIGSTFFYTGTLCKGNTLIDTINCGDGIPDGRIHWENCDLNFDPIDDYVAGEADVTISGSAEDGYLTVDYEMYCSEDTDMIPGEVIFVLTDEKGNVIAVDTDYVDEIIAAGNSYIGSCDIFADEDVLKKTADYAMFVAPARAE